ncbi:hypothetical protein Tco_0644397 [Tanacetum coccineum]
MASNFNNENDPWEFGLDIDDSDLHLTPVLRSSSSTRVEPSPLTPNPVRIIPGPAGIVQLSSSTRVEPSSSTPNPVRIIPGDGDGDGDYGKDIIVGIAMILANISVFTPKPSKLLASGSNKVVELIPVVGRRPKNAPNTSLVLCLYMEVEDDEVGVLGVLLISELLDCFAQGQLLAFSSILGLVDSTGIRMEAPLDSGASRLEEKEADLPLRCMRHSILINMAASDSCNGSSFDWKFVEDIGVMP